jgi:23S rRNA (pseudouridine1915-N3)-methyltransferase
MAITIIALGKIKHSYLQLAVQDYLARIKPMTAISIIEIPEEKVDEGAQEATILQALKKEALAIERYLPKDAFIIALDIHGKTLNSNEFAIYLETRIAKSSTIIFMIGSAHGLHPSMKDKADARITLSALTFPHTLTRVILCEQLYRAFKIIRQQPYHK